MDFYNPPPFFFWLCCVACRTLVARPSSCPLQWDREALPLDFQGSPYPIFFLSKGNVKPNYPEIPLVTDHMVNIKANVNTQG